MFIDIIKSNGVAADVKEQQLRACKKFPELVKKSSSLKLYNEKSPPEFGDYFIIGVATYSVEDMKLLDSIESVALQHCGCIYVYDVLSARNIESMGSECLILLW